MTQPRYLVAGPLRLDLEDERLWRDGEPVRLGGKALQLLRALMERPHRLVTKDDLFDQVWPGLAVSESVLTTAVKEARQALGDSARRPRLIQTVHGRGYRFLVDVAASDEAPRAPAPIAATHLPSRTPRRGRMILAAGLALLLLLGAVSMLLVLRPGPVAQPEAPVTAHAKSIAVLPFEDLSPTHDRGWFAAGLTEEILNSLARTPDLRVAARTSTLNLPPADARRLGALLNVAHLLEGSVRHDGGRVRVTAQLIRASDGFHLWSQNYDRPAADIITIQEEIAIAIARALQTVMSPERLQSMVRLGTRSVDAYEEYLRGLAHEQRELQSGDSREGELAMAAWERARQLDPQFAAAHWQATRGWFGRTTRVGSAGFETRASAEERLREYLVRLDAAIAASRGRPENFKYRSARAAIDLRLREAVALMARYLAARPSDLDALDEMVDLAAYVEDRRLMARAAERIHAISMESGSPLSRALTASVLAGDIEQAIVRSRQQLASRPGEALIQYQAHRALLWGRQRDEARALLARISASDLPMENKLLAELRQACADGGRGATAIARRMERLPDATASGRWHAALLMGDAARANAVLRPLDQADGLPTLVQYLVYPTFDSRAFPNLQARLNADGIRRPPPRRIPFACRPSVREAGADAAGGAQVRPPAA